MKPVSDLDFHEQVSNMVVGIIEMMKTEPIWFDTMETIVEGKQTCKVHVEISFTAVNSPKQVSDENQPQHEAYEPDPF